MLIGKAMNRSLYTICLCALSLACSHVLAASTYSISVNNTKLPLEFNNSGRGVSLEKNKNHLIVLFDTANQSMRKSLTQAGVNLSTKACGNIEYLKSNCSCLGGGNKIKISSATGVNKSYISTVPYENINSAFVICRRS
jgi:hypothetical protein